MCEILRYCEEKASNLLKQGAHDDAKRNIRPSQDWRHGRGYTPILTSQTGVPGDPQKVVSPV